MLRHYDTINWQIGSILIAATVVLTGLVLKKELIDIIRDNNNLSLIIVGAVPLMSFFVLYIWHLWFRRHRELYNFRNETLHRLEIELGFYHYLRVVQAELISVNNRVISGKCKRDIERLYKAKINAGHNIDNFEPFYVPINLSKPSGYVLSKYLAYGIPTIQLLILITIKYA